MQQKHCFVPSSRHSNDMIQIIMKVLIIPQTGQLIVIGNFDVRLIFSISIIENASSRQYDHCQDDCTETDDFQHLCVNFVGRPIDHQATYPHVVGIDRNRDPEDFLVVHLCPFSIGPFTHQLLLQGFLFDRGACIVVQAARHNFKLSVDEKNVLDLITLGYFLDELRYFKILKKILDILRQNAQLDKSARFIFHITEFIIQTIFGILPDFFDPDRLITDHKIVYRMPFINFPTQHLIVSTRYDLPLTAVNIDFIDFECLGNVFQHLTIVLVLDAHKRLSNNSDFVIQQGCDPIIGFCRMRQIM